MPDLHVVTTVSNPLNFASRYRLYREFSRHIEASGAILHTVELALEDQPFAVTEATNPRHVQVRSRHHIWHKENLINIAIGRLPRDWKYLAWLDADIAFMRPDWVAETLRQLQLNCFVQMFTHVIDLGPNYEPIDNYEGYAYRRLTGLEATKGIGQTGYAWAARREALDSVGGLIDWSILGSNDYFMALGLFGQIEPATTRMPDSNYAAMLLQWQERCRKAVAGPVGYVGNTLVHYWHGRRADRAYSSRWKILVEHQFDPATDLARDRQGVLELTDAKPALRAAIRAYFENRNEDSREL